MAEPETRLHQGRLVGFSAIYDENTQQYGFSSLYELDLIHPSEGWSFVCSTDVKWVEKEKLIRDAVITYRNIGILATITTRWYDASRCVLIDRKIHPQSTRKLSFNPMNVWPSSRRSHDIQVYAGSYHTQDDERPIIFSATSLLGQEVLNSEIIKRLKAKWIPGQPWFG